MVEDLEQIPVPQTDDDEQRWDGTASELLIEPAPGVDDPV
jgi:hypothetical protein